MKTENKMAELLAEFRAQNGEEAEDSGSSIGSTDIAEHKAGTENIETEESTTKAENLTDDEEEEINAEWLELISGMYV